MTLPSRAIDGTWLATVVFSSPQRLPNNRPAVAHSFRMLCGKQAIQLPDERRFKDIVAAKWPVGIAGNQLSLAERRNVLGEMRLWDGDQGIDVDYAPWTIAERFQDHQSNGMGDSAKKASALVPPREIRFLVYSLFTHGHNTRVGTGAISLLPSAKPSAYHLNRG